MKRTRLTESLSDNISNSLRYVIFIDMYPLSTRKGGLSTIMFSNIDHKRLSKWLNGADQSDVYSGNEETLKDIYSKISVSSLLKDLYRTVDKLKSQETSEELNADRVSNIEMVMRKIEKTIKTKLSKEELDLFDEMRDLLTFAAKSAAESIQESVDASTLETEEEPSPEEKEEFEEALRMEAYLKSVIREIVEKRLNLK